MPPPPSPFPPPRGRPRPPKRSLLQNLGAFFGHIAHGVKTPVPSQPAVPPAPPRTPENQPRREVVRHETREREMLTEQGTVVLRRTVIDEIERPAPPAPGGNARPSPQETP